MLITTLLLPACLAADPIAVGASDSGPFEVTSLACEFDPAARNETLSLGMLADEEAAEEDSASLPEHPQVAPYGKQGSTRWYIHGGGGGDIDNNDDTFLIFGAGLSHFIADGLALNAELNGMFINQWGEDTEGANFNLFFRWHFHRERDWSLFIDAGAGLLLTGNDVPANGSSFNFTPQAGLGATFDLGNDARLIVGARWHHLSNANTYSNNPGRDSIMGFAGVSFPF